MSKYKPDVASAMQLKRRLKKETTMNDKPTFWRVEYGNDTGANDEYFYEWWTVTNGERSVKCDTESEGYELCDLLNLSAKYDLTKLEELVKAAEETSARGNGFLDLDNAIKSIKR